MNIYKISSNKGDKKELPELEMKKYMALLKSLQMYYQHAHWISKGEPYFSDHLLFERLYNSTNEQIDSLGEKLVGLGGDSYVCVKTIVSMMNQILEKVSEMDENTLGYELATDALKLEEAFLELNASLYDSLKEDGSLTLGLDDLIMSFHNEHESNVYLLQQRTKKN